MRHFSWDWLALFAPATGMHFPPLICQTNAPLIAPPVSRGRSVCNLTVVVSLPWCHQLSLLCS